MCENDTVLHAPSQPFFYNLSLMNLDFVILEYGHDVSSYMLRNEKLHIQHITIYKHDDHCNNNPVIGS